VWKFSITNRVWFKANTQMAIIIKERTAKFSLRLFLLVWALKRMKNFLEINMKDTHLRAILPKVHSL